MILIRDASVADEFRWRALWANYCRFYEQPISDAVTQATWQRILDPGVPMSCRIAEADGCISGFSISVLHEGTWAIGKICYLEDLYVEEAKRGAGIGRALIQDLIDMGKARGWARLYWHTHAENVTARRLYDSFCHADSFVRYRLVLSEN